MITSDIISIIDSEVKYTEFNVPSDREEDEVFGVFP